MELLPQRAVVLHLRMEAAFAKQFDNGGRTPRLGVARLVVGQEYALFHITGYHRLFVRAVLMRISNNVNHIIKNINVCNFLLSVSSKICVKKEKEGILCGKTS